MFNACGFNMYQNVNTSACKYCLCTDKFLWACAYVCECLCSRDGCKRACNWSYKVGLHINYTCQKQYFVREKEDFAHALIQPQRREGACRTCPCAPKPLLRLSASNYKPGHEATHEQIATIPVDYPIILFSLPKCSNVPVGS